MMDLSPFWKWCVPAIAALAVLIAFRNPIVKSERGRWLAAFMVSLVLSPVVVPGCPGLSLEPAWVVLPSLRFDGFGFMLEFVGFFVMPSVAITTGVVGAVLEVISRRASTASP